ncbi:MAG: hypothetical protein HC915_20120 [Anaerolineae bacterium]|nr:hypothetical protein [Anaerolineae bacterium]
MHQGTVEGSQRVQTTNGRLLFSLVPSGKPTVLAIEAASFRQTLEL